MQAIQNEITATLVEADGHVTIVEVDIDAEGHIHGEMVELDAEGHIVQAQELEMLPDGQVAIVEVEIDPEGMSEAAPDGSPLEAPQAVDPSVPSQTEDGQTEWVFDTDDYVPSSTPGDDWSPEG